MEGLALQAVRNCCAKKTWRSWAVGSIFV
jgi:hypothetical protein